MKNNRMITNTKVSCERIISTLLNLVIITSLCACADHFESIDQPTINFLESDEYVTAPMPGDQVRLEKADVIVLPTISLSVYVIGALVAYVSGIMIYESVADEGMDLWDLSWSGDHVGDYDYFLDEPVDLASEVQAQAEHLSESLATFAYRSEDERLPGVTGQMMINMINAYAHVSNEGLEAAKDILNGRIRPLAEAPRAFINQLRVASSRGRNMDTKDGLCVKALVKNKNNIEFVGRAKARGAADVIRAGILAGLKATARCGIYHEEVMEKIRQYANVQNRYRVIDQLFYHLFVTGQVLYSYAGQCTLPPMIEVLENQDACVDTAWL